MIESLNALWGATMVRLDVDLLRQSLTLSLHLTNSQAGDSTHIMEFSQVTECRIFNAVPVPWDYVEITEIHATTGPGGSVIVEFVLWSEDAGLQVRAGSLYLDGETMTVGRGVSPDSSPGLLADVEVDDVARGSSEL